MKLYLTGEPCTQQRHCYFVRSEAASFIVDCGYQRSYGRDALPHIPVEYIRESQYLFLTQGLFDLICVIHFDDFTLYRSYALFFRKEYVTGKLLCNSACSAYFTAAGN